MPNISIVNVNKAKHSVPTSDLVLLSIVNELYSRMSRRPNLSPGRVMSELRSRGVRIDSRRILQQIDNAIEGLDK